MNSHTDLNGSCPMVKCTPLKRLDRKRLCHWKLLQKTNFNEQKNPVLQELAIKVTTFKFNTED